MKVIKPLFCLEESCVSFTAVTLCIFPSVILPFSCLLSSNVLLSKSASQVSVFCMSSGLVVVQYPNFFIVWFIFHHPGPVLHLLAAHCLTSTTFFLKWESYPPVSLQCFSTVVWYEFKVSGLYQNTINNGNTIQVCMKFKIRFFFYITMLSFQCSSVPPIFSLWRTKNALS